uniref:Carboxylate--amine ligase n=1 Tax=Haloterrigena alkaliphila TaxID=2816475 RepID=A0A8A2VK88_9EURY
MPTGYDPASYSCVRSLSRRGIHTIVASEHENALATASTFCDEVISIPSPESDFLRYKAALLRIAARDDVRTIVPVRAPDPYLLSKYFDEFSDEVTVVTPGFETIESVHDRIRLIEAAQNAGVPVPETNTIDEVTDWESEQIIKSRYNVLTEEYCDSYSERDFATAKRVKHLDAGERPDPETIREEMHHDPLVQEYVCSSDEYVFGALYDHGEPVTTFQHRQIRGESYTGGGGVYRRSIDIPELEAVGRTLLDHLEWHGPACIEYMRDAETDEFKLTEINPRLWQSLPCAVRAGADFPLDYWRLATGRPDSVDPEYETGVGSHLLYGELGYLSSVVNEESALVDRPSLFGAGLEILVSCCMDPHFDLLRYDDPRVFLSGLRYVLTETSRAVHSR